MNLRQVKNGSGGYSHQISIYCTGLLCGVSIGMPATRTNRRNNPLRKLRLILGKKDRPLHQEEFADWIGVSVATIRSVEGGRRPMTGDNCLNQIAIVLFAHWGEHDHEWHLLDPFGPPYQKQHSVLVKQFDHSDPYTDDQALHHLISRLLDLFAATTRQQRLSLLIYVNKHLAEIAKESGLKVDLERTEPDWRITVDCNIWGKWSTKPAVLRPRYSKTPLLPPDVDAGGMLDFRARRTFNPADYPAKTPAEVDAMIEEKRRSRKKITVP
jgi:hypothetical protein